MKVFTIEIEEYLSKTIKVEAKTEEEAIMIGKKMYDEEKIILDNNDFISKNIKVIKNK